MKHEIIFSTHTREDERGLFVEVLNDGHWENLIYGVMKQGATMGNHYHKKTEIFFFLKKGAARISVVHVENGERDRFTLEENQGVVLRTCESHAIRFVEDSEFIMMKSLRYNTDDPDTFPFPVEEPL